MSDEDEYDTGIDTIDTVEKEIETPVNVTTTSTTLEEEEKEEVSVSRRKSSTPIRRKKTGQRYTTKTVKRTLTQEPTTGKRRKYRYRPGVVALREIRKYQTTTGTLIDKAPFRRLLKDITDDLRPGIRWRKAAVVAIQESAESLIIELFSNSRLYTEAAGRETLMPQDLRLAFHNKFSEHPTMDFTKLLH